MSFPTNFIWGTATSSYQIEGASNEDGKGASIWDDFTKQPNRVLDKSSGDVACDHYHRFREDIKLMAELGIKSYRFSISWPRILPNGTGRIEQRGIKFYSDLVDCLMEHNIRPIATLYHWDLPSALEEKGAWLNPEMPEWFAEYTRAVVAALGNRVKSWITINEPQCVIGSSYTSCELAPGEKKEIDELVPMIHNLLKSHGRAVQVIRAIAPDAMVGYAPCAAAPYPASNSPEDIAAARNNYFTVSPSPHALGWSVSWFSDPVCLGKYPEDGLKLFGKYLPQNWEQDMALIGAPIDFYAQNIYQGFAVTADGVLPFKQGYARTAIGWPVTPEALYWGPKFLYERYKLPIIISENGMSCHDSVSLDGKVHDPNRIDFLARYLSELKRAIADGADIRGYYYWTFVDNFEWAHGYTQRFGLVYIDYDTQKRIPKDSAYWYKQVIERNGELL